MLQGEPTLGAMLSRFAAVLSLAATGAFASTEVVYLERTQSGILRDTSDKLVLDGKISSLDIVYSALGLSKEYSEAGIRS